MRGFFKSLVSRLYHPTYMNHGLSRHAGLLSHKSLTRGATTYHENLSGGNASWLLLRLHELTVKASQSGRVRRACLKGSVLQNVETSALSSTKEMFHVECRTHKGWRSLEA